MNVYFSFPFFSDSVLKENLKLFFPVCNLIIAWEVNRAVFSNVQERLSVELDSEMMYKFTCDCGDS